MLPLSCRIPLNAGKRGFCLVSAEDFPYLSQFNWTRDTTGYVCRAVAYYDQEGKRHRRKILMHREILQIPSGVQGDHRRGNPLDNRRHMLRPATYAQNRANTPSRGGTSKYRGVYMHKSGRWRATLMIDGKRKHLGAFEREEDAAKVADLALYRARGEYAFLNHPDLRPFYSMCLARHRQPA